MRPPSYTRHEVHDADSEPRALESLSILPTTAWPRTSDDGILPHQNSMIR